MYQNKDPHRSNVMLAKSSFVSPGRIFSLYRVIPQLHSSWFAPVLHRCGHQLDGHSLLIWCWSSVYLKDNWLFASGPHKFAAKLSLGSIFVILVRTHTSPFSIEIKSAQWHSDIKTRRGTIYALFGISKVNTIYTLRKRKNSSRKFNWKYKLALTSRYFKVPWHGSIPKAEGLACNMHLDWPWHSYLATIMDEPAWQWVFLLCLNPQIPLWVRPYEALRMLMTFEWQFIAIDLLSQTRRKHPSENTKEDILKQMFLGGLLFECRKEIL